MSRKTELIPFYQACALRDGGILGPRKHGTHPPVGLKRLMPAVWSWKGTHAKGSCEPGQAGRCSHKQPTLVQWISLLRRRPRAPFSTQVSIIAGTAPWKLLTFANRPCQTETLLQPLHRPH